MSKHNEHHNRHSLPLPGPPADSRLGGKLGNDVAQGKGKAMSKKINVYADGEYLCSTTRAARCKDAVEAFVAFRYTNGTPEYVKQATIAGRGTIALDGVKVITARFA